MGQQKKGFGVLSQDWINSSTGAIAMAVLAMALCTGNAQADDRPSDTALRVLKQSGSEAAWRFVRANETRHAGEPAFDRAAARVAIAAGRMSDATMALERAVASENKAEDRLELIGAYLRMGDMRSAQAHLQQYRSSNSDAQAIELLRDRLLNLEDHYRQQDFRNRRRFDRSIGVMIGHDDNYLSSSDLDNFLGLNLNGSQAARQSTYSSYTGSMRLAQGFSDKLSAFARVGGSFQRLNDDSQYNRRSGRVQVGVDRALGAVRTRVSGSYSALKMDEGFRSARLGAEASVRYTNSRRQTWSAAVEASRARFDSDNNVLDHDALDLRVGVRFGPLFKGHLRPFAYALWGDTNPAQTAGARYGRQHTGARIGFDLKLPAKWTLSLTGNHKRTHYDGMFFGADRRNTTQSVALQASWRRIGQKIWTTGLFARYATRDSSIDLFDYDRTRVGVQTTMSWR